MNDTKMSGSYTDILQNNTMTLLFYALEILMPEVPKRKVKYRLGHYICLSMGLVKLGGLQQMENNLDSDMELIHNSSHDHDVSVKDRCGPKCV